MNQQSILAIGDRYKRVFTIMNWSVPALIGIFIFCNPFPYTTAITNISFYLVIFITLVLIIFKRIKFVFKTPLTYPLIIFLLWSALSIFWSLNVENTVNDVRGNLLNYIILYFLLVNFFNSSKRLNLLAWIMVASATVFSIVGMVYYYIIMDSPITTRFGFLLNNSVNVSTELPVNMIGALTISAIVFSLYFFVHEYRLYIRIAIASCAFVIFIATLLTQSRGTFISLLISGTILLLIKKKKIIPFFIVAMVLAFIITPFNNSMDTYTLAERVKIDYVTYEVIKDHPLIGIGFGMQTFRDNIDKKLYFSKIPAQYKPIEIDNPHSLLVDIALRIGLIGLVLFLTIIFVLAKMCRETINHARDGGIKDWGIYLAISFVAYFIMGLAEPLFLFQASAVIFYIILAMMTILWNLNARQGIENDGL